MTRSRTLSAAADTDPLVAAIARAAEALTTDALHKIAAAIAGANGAGASAEAAVHAAALAPTVQDHALRIVRRWASQSPGASGASVALGINAAAETARCIAATQDLRLVITGPGSPLIPVRSTRQVVTELVEEAQERILLVTYAAHPDPKVFDALRAAVKRGVHVDLVREHVWPNQQFHDHAGKIAAGIHLWRWPGPRVGQRLHAKVIVVDEAIALISSANLTGNAMDRNIEAGVRVRGGTLPKSLARHFGHLISDGVLTSG